MEMIGREIVMPMLLVSSKYQPLLVFLTCMSILDCISNSLRSLINLSSSYLIRVSLWALFVSMITLNLSSNCLMRVIISLFSAFEASSVFKRFDYSLPKPLAITGALLAFSSYSIRLLCCLKFCSNSSFFKLALVRANCCSMYILASSTSNLSSVIGKSKSFSFYFPLMITLSLMTILFPRNLIDLFLNFILSISLREFISS